jgi:hypothetical protein
MSEFQGGRPPRDYSGSDDVTEVVGNQQPPPRYLGSDHAPLPRPAPPAPPGPPPVRYAPPPQPYGPPPQPPRSRRGLVIGGAIAAVVVLTAAVVTIAVLNTGASDTASTTTTTTRILVTQDRPSTTPWTQPSTTTPPPAPAPRPPVPPPPIDPSKPPVTLTFDNQPWPISNDVRCYTFTNYFSIAIGDIHAAGAQVTLHPGPAFAFESITINIDRYLWHFGSGLTSFGPGNLVGPDLIVKPFELSFTCP